MGMQAKEEKNNVCFLLILYRIRWYIWYQYSQYNNTIQTQNIIYSKYKKAQCIINKKMLKK